MAGKAATGFPSSRDGRDGFRRDRFPIRLTNTTDIFATLASVVGYQLPDDVATDSFDMLPAMLGIQDPQSSIRPHLLTQSFRGEFQIRQGDWKYLDHRGSGGNSYDKGILEKYALAESEPAATGQLYNLATDPGETDNLFFKESAKREQLQALLNQLKESGRSAPQGQVANRHREYSTAEIAAESAPFDLPSIVRKKTV